MNKDLWNAVLRELNKTPEQYQHDLEQRKKEIANPTFGYNGEDLNEAKEMKIKELSYRCKQEIINGFLSSALGVEHTYPSDEEAQRNLQGAIVDTVIDSTVTNVNFKTLDSGYLDHTVEQIKQVGKDWKIHLTTNLEKYNHLKAQVHSCTSISDVEVILW